jgi:putative transposase
MRREGLSASYNTVKRIFKELKNLTKDLDIKEAFQVLSSDISYIRTAEGFDYLCQVRDAHTNTVLAETQSSRMKKDLLIETIERVMNRWNLPENVIFHSDRGSQCTAKEVVDKITGYGWKQSFSRVGKPGDNAWSESFFAILKKEIVHWRVYKTREETRKAIFEYIEVFYNRQRAQKRLGYLSPIEYLTRYIAENYALVA